MSVEKGEIYGFLGLNGAGKTTLIRILLGLIRPTSGSAFLKGLPVKASQNELWQKIGYLVETPAAYPELSVRDNLEISRRLRGISDAHAVEAVIAQLNLTPYRNQLARHLSLGNAQRLGIAKALIHQPEILILDEPSNGLDPAGMVEIRQLLHQLAYEQGVTVLISSHLLGEIAKFATRIGMIHQGQLLQEFNLHTGTPFQTRKLVIRVREPERARALLASKGFSALLNPTGELEISDPLALEQAEMLNSWLVQADCPPSRLNLEEEDLEAYFLRMIQRWSTA